MKEYCLYKGEDILHFGTIEEIAEKEGVKPTTIEHYKYPAYQRKSNKKSSNRKVLVALD